MTHERLVELVADTASRFMAVVVALDDDRWSAPGLGEWSVRELVAHTLRAFSTVDRFLDEPQPVVEVTNSAEYFRVGLSPLTVHDEIAERARESSRSLGDDPKEFVVRQISATLGRLAETDGGEIGRTAAGAMRLSDYLETRLVELVVHYTDLCVAVDVEVADLGDAAVVVCTTVLASASPADRVQVLRSMLGREPLPPSFNVWP